MLLKNIPVYINETQVRTPDTGADIFADDGLALVTLIRDTQMKPGGCVDYCTAGIRYEIARGGWRGQQGAEVLNRAVYLHTACNNTLHHIAHRAKCGCGSRRTADCIKSLAHGKCVDEFMRNTVGAILYPQFYANEK